MNFIASSSKQTRAIGNKIAKEILKTKNPGGASFIMALEGDLGAGKTTFLQGFAKGLGIKATVNSPTFVIMKIYQLPTINYKLSTANYKLFYHFDFYRLQKKEELLDLGWQEITADPRNIVAIEWSERLKNVLPKNCFNIRFQFLNQNTRKITLSKRYHSGEGVALQT